MNKAGLAALAVLLPPLLAGCTPVDHAFGETHRWNIEQQVIDPDPQYAGDLLEGGSGERGADAVQRYNEGEVKQPVRPTTTSAGSRGSGGSGPR